jgi:hypothetical protein
MPSENLLLQTLLNGGSVTFDPDHARTAPFTAEVELLLGGVPIKVFPDGSEQFIDDDDLPARVYSPRLSTHELEAFCETNIEKYQAFNAEHGDETLITERVHLPPFW